MKKIAGFILFLNIIYLTLQAQTNVNAQSILDKASAKVLSAKGINVSFSLTQKDNSNHSVSGAKGVLKIKGSKYYIKQDANEIFCDGAQTWNYDGQNEVTVTKVDNDDDELSPQQILTGFNKKDFDITLLTSTTTNYKVQLIPVDKRQNFNQVIVFVSKSTNLISKAIITDKTNSVTEINFNTISLNNSFADNQFVFDSSKHPGVEVVNQ